MNIKIATTKDEIKDAFHVRTIVFVNEQNVPPEREQDKHDDHAVHFIGYKDARPIAASRVRLIDSYGKLERICVLKEFRGKSYGSQIIKFMEKVIVIIISYYYQT